MTEAKTDEFIFYEDESYGTALQHTYTLLWYCKLLTYIVYLLAHTILLLTHYVLLK